jgi:hypothetical protein
VILCVRRLPEDGTCAETCRDDTYHELYFMICISLHFIKCIGWSIYRIYENERR